MKIIDATRFLCILFAFLGPGAQAMIVEGSFRGTVSGFESYDYEPVNGFWMGAPVGSEFYGTFWYDTSFLGPDTVGSYYSDTDEWMGSSFFVDGKSYTLSEIPPAADGLFFGEQMDLRDFGLGKEFYFLDMVGSGALGRRSHMATFLVAFASDHFPVFSGWDLLQNFHAYDIGNPNDDTAATAVIGLFIESGKGTTSTSMFIDVDEFHLKIRNTANVPEPPSIMLLCLGIAALLVRCKKNRVPG